MWVAYFPPSALAAGRATLQVFHCSNIISNNEDNKKANKPQNSHKANTHNPHHQEQQQEQEETTPTTFSWFAHQPQEKEGS